ncbi:MAG: tRNA pseudouridine(55) synthase TruB [Pseudomonadota bacterium]
MARRKRGRDVHGWLVLDKAYDVGSTEAVGKARRLFDAKKAGHAGTLDPLATGVLPIAFGEATKTAPFVQDGEKTYRFAAQFGAATTTDDLEGEVIARSDVLPTAGAIEAVLPRFIGDIEQRPPQFSAVRVGGERAYDLARAGEAVEIASRPAFVAAFRLLAMPAPDTAEFEARTGKGVYVRSLVRDLAEALGSHAHVVELRRTAVGPFTEGNAVAMAELEAADPDERDAMLEGVDSVFADYPQASVDGTAAARLRNGQTAVMAPVDARGVRAGEAGALETVFVTCEGDPVAICALDGLALKPTRVFGF